jgi:hypothetical protein
MDQATNFELDLDLLNIFIDTMCVDSKKKSMIIVDELMSNYANLIEEI